MRILITSGGTAERIDDVRSITNHSTGQLGRLITEEFLNNQAEVDLVTTSKAVHPAENDHLRLYFIESTQDLVDTLERLLGQNQYDVIIHSMAVSDFSYEQSFSEEVFLSRLNHVLEGKKYPLTKAEVRQLITESEETQAHKISSDTDHLLIVLKKTPKVIQRIKKIQPSAKLVGFKLLSDVSKEELIATARESLVKNNADFVLANDLSTIDNNQHIGYLIDRNWQIIGEAKTKTDIAHLIFKTIRTEVN